MSKLTDLNTLVRKNKSSKGSWKLDSRHRLTYQSEDFEDGKKKKSYAFETSLVAAEAGALVVSVTQKQDDNTTITSLAQLKGTWQASVQNQLEFIAQGQSKNKAVTFTGSWKVGDCNEIIYEFRDRPKSKLQTLTFKGYWQLTEKKRLSYLVEGDSDSAFRFRGAFQTSSISAKKGEIRYQLGAELGSKQKTLKRKKFRSGIVTLFGKWKLSDKLGLSFEMEYENEIKELRFGCEYSLTPNLEISANLISPEGKSLGIEVVFTKDFAKIDAQAFIRLRKALSENAIEAGITILW